MEGEKWAGSEKGEKKKLKLGSRGERYIYYAFRSEARMRRA